MENSNPNPHARLQSPKVENVLIRWKQIPTSLIKHSKRILCSFSSMRQPCLPFRIIQLSWFFFSILKFHQKLAVFSGEFKLTTRPHRDLNHSPSSWSSNTIHRYTFYFSGEPWLIHGRMCPICLPNPQGWVRMRTRICTEPMFWRLEDWTQMMLKTWACFGTCLMCSSNLYFA